MGNLQPVGKVQPAMLREELKRMPMSLLSQIAARSTDWWVMSEDLPDPENRVDAERRWRYSDFLETDEHHCPSPLYQDVEGDFQGAGVPAGRDENNGNRNKLPSGRHAAVW